MIRWSVVFFCTLGMWSGFSIPDATAVQMDCTPVSEVGYENKVPFDITVVHLDGKPVEENTACVFWQMAEAAAKDGITLEVSSGFRTMAQQEYYWNCYQTCTCNDCNPAAEPGTSKHQSGFAIDIKLYGACPKYTSVATCKSKSPTFAWLHENGNDFGFYMTFQPECWHWVYKGNPEFVDMGCPCQGCVSYCKNDKKYVAEDCSTGNCGPEGTCFTVDDLPICASEGCVAEGELIPSGTQCSPEGNVVTCDDSGFLTVVETCPEGMPCNDCLTCGPLPSEMCDGLDNDCDGDVDEGFEIGTPCKVGDCPVTGLMICSEDGMGATCSAVIACEDWTDSNEGSPGEENGEEGLEAVEPADDAADEVSGTEEVEMDRGWTVDQGGDKTGLVSTSEGNVPTGFGPSPGFATSEPVDDGVLEGNGGGCQQRPDASIVSLLCLVWMLALATLGNREGRSPRSGQENPFS